MLVIESNVPPNSTQELGNGLLASSEVSAVHAQNVYSQNVYCFFSQNVYCRILGFPQNVQKDFKICNFC
jgi:hypothetical protein